MARRPEENPFYQQLRLGEEREADCRRKGKKPGQGTHPHTHLYHKAKFLSDSKQLRLVHLQDQLRLASVR